MYQINQTVNISPKVAAKHGVLAQVKNRCFWGAYPKYLIKFPDNTALWTDAMAITGESKNPFHPQLNLF